MGEEKKQKKKRQSPDTYVIVFALVVVVCILTYLIPAGTYKTVEGTKNIDPNSFTFLEESNPASFLDFLNSFMSGMTKGASTIFICLFIGGGFGILQDTGAVHAGLAWLIRKTKGNYKIIFPAFMVVMGVLGALGVGNNVALAFVPLLLFMARKMRLDAVAIAAVCYVGSNTGFSASPLNPFTVGICQDIAGLPNLSGLGVRICCWVVFVVTGIWFVLNYCNKITKDPSKSITGILEDDESGDASADEKYKKFSAVHIINLGIMLATFVLYAVGGVVWDWGLNELGTSMLFMGIACGIVGRMSPNDMAKSFTNGAKTMLYSSMVIGFASAISVIMTDSNIIHSIVYYLTLPLASLPTALSAVGMYIVSVICNFPISSGSAKAYVVMPIMAPAADVLGVTRQVCVSAYQFGDGLCNFIAPTNGLMMGTIAMAGVSLGQWFKFIWKYVVLTSILACGFLIVATLVGWA